LLLAGEKIRAAAEERVFSLADFSALTIVVTVLELASGVVSFEAHRLDRERIPVNRFYGDGWYWGDEVWRPAWSTPPLHRGDSVARVIPRGASLGVHPSVRLRWRLTGPEPASSVTFALTVAGAT
jgi:hypothetical protein